MSDPSPFVADVEVRSYELDAFGHLNHAVYLSYFEYARFQMFEAMGHSARTFMEQGHGIHVVRVEVDYRREARLGQAMRILTRPEAARATSFSLRHVAHAPDDADTVFAEARVVLVWVGANGRPMRVPDEVRAGLGLS